MSKNRKRAKSKAAADARSKTAPASGRGTRNRHEGARVSRLTQDWIFAATSQDQDVRTDGRRMRLRARDLQRNSPLIRQYLQLLRQNVVGFQLPTLRFTNRLPNGKLDIELNKYLAQRFREWAKIATADGTLSLLRFLWRGVTGTAVDGESFTRRIFGYPHNEFGFALEHLEPDLIDEQLNSVAVAGHGPDIRLGVEVDEWRRRVRYWFWDGYPEERRAHQRVPIPAEQVFHLFEPERAVQTRGVTWLKAVMTTVKMFDGMTEAEVVASRSAASKLGFLTHKSEDAAFEPPGDADVNEYQVEVDTTPGHVETLPPGLGFESWDPQHPNSAMPQFMKMLQRLIASGANVAYNPLANDLESVSWSSLRSGLLVERDTWRCLQTTLCDPGGLLPWIVEGWLETSSLTGAVRLPSRDWRQYTAHRWLPRGWEWVEPNAEAKAIDLQMRRYLASLRGVLASRGIALEDMVDDIKEVREILIAAGLDPDPPSSVTASSSGAGAAGGPGVGGDGSANQTDGYTDPNATD